MNRFNKIKIGLLIYVTGLYISTFVSDLDTRVLIICIFSAVSLVITEI